MAGDVTADEDLWPRPDAQLVLSGYAILNGSQSAAVFFSDRLLLCLASWVTMLKRCVCVWVSGGEEGVRWGVGRGLSRSRAHY